MQPGRRRRLIIGAALLLVALWIASGALFRDDEPEVEFGTSSEYASVAVRVSRAEPVERVLVLQGDLQPEQVVEVRAETSGRVRTWHVPRGAAVEENALLVELEPGERSSRLRQAQAGLRVARQQLYATRELVADGYEPDIQVETAEADLQAAHAELAAIEEEIERTRIRAPIPGRINERMAEVGDYLGAGGQVAQIVNNHPLRATVQVPQHQVGRLAPGQPARVHVLGHGEAAGSVTFVGSLADAGTRTFRVEVEIPNPDRVLPAGTSAEVEIITEQVMAHKVSPAIVNLDDEGQVGVKTVDDQDRVQFHPVTVVRAERDGLWVTGLPPQARIVTVGQGFVSAGERVLPRDVAELETGTAGSRAEDAR